MENDYNKLIYFLKDKDLNDFLINNEILKISNFKHFNKEDILVCILLSAIDKKDYNAINNIIDNKIKNIDISYEIYTRCLLTKKILEYIIENEKGNFKVSKKLIRKLMKDKREELLDIIFENFKIFDNEIIISFCNMYKNEIPLSKTSLNNDILNNKYKISVRGTHVNKYLINSCEEGKEYLVKYLIKNGADLNESIESNTLPLIAACRNGNEKIIEYLIEQGANVNQKDEDGVTPLHEACENDKENIVKHLIEHGANINEENKYGETPLLIACRNGNENIVKILIENGININRQDSYYNTPLLAACENGNEQIVRYLVEHGANINEGRCKPLTAACKINSLNIVKYLVEHGANINSKNLSNIVPLAVACENGNEEIVKYLIECGANIDQDTNCYSIHNYFTPLTIACRKGNENIIKFLIKNGADINKTDRANNTPLSAAFENGNEDIIKFLIKNGANIDEDDYLEKYSIEE